MNLKSFDSHVGSLQCRCYGSAIEEALGITEALKDQAQPSDFAVLARTNDIAGGIAAVLRDHGVPFRTRWLAELPADWRLARAALDVLARPKSPSVFKRYLSVVNPSDAVKIINEFERTQSRLTTELPITGDADKMDDELKMLRVSDESRVLILQRLSEIPERASLADLAVSLAIEPPVKDEGEGVFIGTIHAAKGNEWKTVVLAGFEDEVIPGHRKKTDVEEERRVAYVGLTRASENVHITWAKWRPGVWPGCDPNRTESRFIAEMEP